MDWNSIFFGGWAGLIRAVVASATAYVGLIVVLRVSGKRSLSKLNVFDFVVTVALGSTLATILLSQDVALAEGMMAFVMLIGLQWLVARLSVRWKPLRRLIRSEPRLLLQHGTYNHNTIKDERITEVEVDAAIRKHGFGDRSEVAWVVLESDGSFSIISEDSAGNGSALRSVPDEPPPNG